MAALAAEGLRATAPVIAGDGSSATIRVVATAAG
jgi:hypothetical protein